MPTPMDPLRTLRLLLTEIAETNHMKLVGFGAVPNDPNAFGDGPDYIQVQLVITPETFEMLTTTAEEREAKAKEKEAFDALTKQFAAESKDDKFNDAADRAARLFGDGPPEGQPA